MTPESWQILVGLGGISFVVYLIRTQQTIKGYVREMAGIKEKQTTEIADQPISVKAHVELVDKQSFHEHAKLERERHEKNEQRIATLERKLESDKHEIIEAGEDRADAIHERINVVIEKVGELRGEVKHIAARIHQ